MHIYTTQCYLLSFLNYCMMMIGILIIFVLTSEEGNHKFRYFD